MASGDAKPPRKTGGVRSCYNKNGSPKTAFASRKAAERAIPKTTTGLAPYACEQHGWHLGHRRR
jgi:hypothetical protein